MPNQAIENDGTVTVTLGGKTSSLTHHAGETILETARRAGLRPPSSCEAGNCGTCMAHLDEGLVEMRVNDVLLADEVEAGWILTCQSVPTTPIVRVTYEA